MEFLEKEDVQSPKGKIFQLIAAEGIEIEESFNLALDRPSVSSFLRETPFLYLENGNGVSESGNEYTIVVPRFTDLPEKEQAIDLSFTLALCQLRKEKRWTKIFALNSYVLTKLALKRAETICRENGIISDGGLGRICIKTGITKALNRIEDYDFTKRKNIILRNPLVRGFKTINTWIRRFAKIYLSSWMVTLFIWGLHLSGAIVYFPYSKILFGENFIGQTMDGAFIAGFSNFLFMEVLTFYSVVVVLKKAFGRGNER